MKKYTMRKEEIYSGSLVLVNAQHPCRAEQDGEALQPVCAGAPELLMERRAARELNALMSELDGWEQIAAVSGWRSQKEQGEIYARSLLENGGDYTRTYVALPGCSEHETGFAIDLGLRQEKIDFICPQFPDTGICQGFRQRASAYGFIERYPRGKESVTGIGGEPWHFRYVGRLHAGIMEEQGLVLEEYIDFLRAYPYGSKPYLISFGEWSAEVSFLRAQEDRGTVFEAEEMPITVSGNNVDGFIITGWRR